MGKSLGRGLSSILEDNNRYPIINEIDMFSENLNKELESLTDKIKFKTGLNISKNNNYIKIFVTSKEDLQKIKKIFKI
jgi:hypothetical protein